MPGSSVQNLAFIADRQGTTLAAVKSDGARDGTVAYFGRNIVGHLEGASGTGSATNAETGFTGASTPNTDLLRTDGTGSSGFCHQRPKEVGRWALY